MNENLQPRVFNIMSDSETIKIAYFLHFFHKLQELNSEIILFPAVQLKHILNSVEELKLFLYKWFIKYGEG